MELNEYMETVRKNWINKDTPMPVVITRIEQTKDALLMQFVDSTGTVYDKEISTHEYGKAYNFLKYALGSDIRAWQGHKVWFGVVGKYYLPTKIE